MGFGFNLLFIFVLAPLTLVFLVTWLISRKIIVVKTLGLIWLIVFGMIFLLEIFHFFTAKKELTRDDIYDSYIINRTKYPGKQADWQYDHFRFEITKDNKFIFYKTDRGKINKCCKGTVKFLAAYKVPRVLLDVDTPGYHIINDKPTLYRTTGSFYYVFHSPKFGNVFFKKGNWKPMDK